MYHLLLFTPNISAGTGGLVGMGQRGMGQRARGWWEEDLPGYDKGWVRLCLCPAGRMCVRQLLEPSPQTFDLSKSGDRSLKPRCGQGRSLLEAQRENPSSPRPVPDVAASPGWQTHPSDLCLCLSMAFPLCISNSPPFSYEDTGHQN